jgi:hypothetical protein
MCYNLICIFICTPIWTKKFILVKSGCYTAAPPSTTVLGQSPTAAAAVQPRSASTTAAGGSLATTAVYTCRLPVLQLRENRPLHQGLSSAQAGQCTSCSIIGVDQHRGQQRGPASRTGRINYTTVDGIPTGEEVLAGTFFLNERPIVILFDSRGIA